VLSARDSSSAGKQLLNALVRKTQDLRSVPHGEVRGSSYYGMSDHGMLPL
jgi:hypothetical protein